MDLFPLGRDERRTPFAKWDEPGVNGRWWFLYLTGRGTFSSLFLAQPLDEVVHLAQETIPFGYTQLWVLEWQALVANSTGKVRGLKSKKQYLCNEQRPVVDHSYCLIGEQKGIIGHTDSLHKARQVAQVYYYEHYTPIVIGLLRADVNWH